QRRAVEEVLAAVVGGDEAEAALDDQLGDGALHSLLRWLHELRAPGSAFRGATELLLGTRNSERGAPLVTGGAHGRGAVAAADRLVAARLHGRLVHDRDAAVGAAQVALAPAGPRVRAAAGPLHRRRAVRAA